MIRMYIAMSPSSYFMEFDSVVSIILLTVESDIWEVIPDRENRCIDEIREHDFIEHHNNRKRYNDILVAHNIGIHFRYFDDIGIVCSIFDDAKNISYFEYISLFYTIEKYRKKDIYENACNHDILDSIKEWTLGLRKTQPTMKRKKNRKDKDEVDRSADKKDGKSEREESALSTEGWIPNQENGE